MVSTPRRGDLIWLSFTPQTGRKQAGRRPALVLSPEAYNSKTGLALICPVTSKVKSYPFEVPISTSAGVQGVVLADQLRSLDWRARRAEWIEQAQPKVVERVLKLLDTLLTS